MNQKCIFRLVLAIAGVLGSVAFDRGPLVSVAYAQRDDDDDEGDRGERFRGRGRGGDAGDGGPRWGGRGRGGFGGGPPGEGGPRWGGRGRGGRGFGGGGEEGGERRRRPDDDDEDRPNRGSDGDSRPSTTEFAQQRVKMLDKNGNNMLEGEELEGLRGPEARADANGDKTITVEEIVAAISNRNGSSDSQGSRDRGRRGSNTSNASSDKATTADGNGSKVYLGLAAVMSALSDEKSEKPKNDEATKRKTYRFTPAEDRLPSGLPSWFKSRDRNKDGQVSMNEYRSSWSASAVRDFTRLDANNDGVITPKEAAD